MAQNAELRAGRQLDKAVAGALGWWQPEGEEPFWCAGADQTTRRLPSFSTDEGAAVRAFMDMRTKHQRVNMTFDKHGGYAEINTGHPRYLPVGVGAGDTLCLAICAAILQAKEAKRDA